MKKTFIIIFLTFSFSSLYSQVIPDAYSGFTLSYKYDKNTDFFGDEKFLRDSNGKKISLGYIYDGILGFDLSYDYSFHNRRDIYFFPPTNPDSVLSEDENFNFIDDFRIENARLEEKGYSFGLTYYLNENQSLFNLDLPINFSFGLRYGTTEFKSKALDFLNQDFYGKFYSFEIGAFKEIETASSFYLIPRIKLSVSNEKNIHNSINLEANGTDSIEMTTNFFEVGMPFVFDENSFGQFFIEPSIANKYGTTHLGLRFGFLF
tara:strand:+ start:84 stop:869 length:786 start_codon:yes stop_codon:yes gene_type:complete